MPQINPFQFRSEDGKFSADFLRDGSVDMRVSIGATYMGTRVPQSEVADLVKFLSETTDAVNLFQKKA